MATHSNNDGREILGTVKILWGVAFVLLGIAATATCLQSVQPHLDDNETTVGTHVNVSHTGPAREGEEVTIKSRLTEIKKRRLLFEIEVLAPQGPVSTGTHERAVVDLARMAGG